MDPHHGLKCDVVDGEEMFSSRVQSSVERREGDSAIVREKEVFVPSLRGELTLPTAHGVSPYAVENPYEPPRFEPEQRLRPTLLEIGEERVTRYIQELIEDSHGVSVTKYIAGCILCGGSAATFLSGVGAHILANPLSATDAPQFILLGGILGLTAMYIGIECGIVVAHRAWKRLRRSAEAD